MGWKWMWDDEDKWRGKRRKLEVVGEMGIGAEESIGRLGNVGIEARAKSGKVKKFREMSQRLKGRHVEDRESRNWRSEEGIGADGKWKWKRRGRGCGHRVRGAVHSVNFTVL